MIKKNKIPYNSLNKESILSMITHFERNNKGQKSEALLNKKTQRKKSKFPKENINQTSNIARKGLCFGTRGSFDEGSALRTRGFKNSASSLYASNIIRRKKKENFLSLTNSILLITSARSRRNLKRRPLAEDFVYEDETEEEFDEESLQDNENIQISEENCKDLVKKNLNIIINKSVLFQNFVKEEEERLSQSQKSSERSDNREFQYNETKNGKFN